MVKKIKKSYRSNAKARKYLEKNDHKDIHFFPHTRFIKDVHFQGLDFDGIASYGTQLVLFQVKSNCQITKNLKQQYRKVSQKYGIICMWINVIDRKGVEVWT